MKLSSMLAAGAAMLVLPSCASLFQPYELGDAADIYDPLCKTAGCDRLKQVSDRATKLQSSYLKAAGHDEQARNLAGSGLTVAAAYAMVLGVSDGIGPANAADQITGLGALSAATLGITSIYTNPIRQKVFIAGAQAVSCARLAASPFELYPADLARLNRVLDGTATPPTGSLYDVVAEVEMYVDLIEGLAVGVPPEYIAGVRLELESAKAALKRGYAVRRQVTHTAPTRMSGHLADIDASVGTQLQATTVDLNTILTIRANLQSSAAAIAPKFGEAKKTPPDPVVAGAFAGPGFAGLAAPVASYDRSLAEMRSATTFINVLADDIEHVIKSTDTTFAKCSFEPVSLALRLSTNKLEIAQGKTKSFLVSEGQPPFVADVIDASADISAKFVPAFGDRAMVEVGSAVAAGDYEISVYDRTNKPVTLTVTVK